MMERETVGATGGLKRCCRNDGRPNKQERKDEKKEAGGRDGVT